MNQNLRSRIVRRTRIQDHVGWRLEINIINIFKVLSNPNIFATQCRIPLIFQTMISVRPNNLSLKYQRFASSDTGIRQFEFVTETQFLYTAYSLIHKILSSLQL